MTRRTILSRSLMAAIILLGATSCSEYENGFTESGIRYAEDFKAIFGNIDPNHDWCMATTLTANVSTAGATEHSIVKIYAGSPAKGDAIALFQGTSARFSVLKGTQQVYAEVVDNGKVIKQGYYNVVDGNVNIGDNPVANGATTRGDNDKPINCYMDKVKSNFITYKDKDNVEHGIDLIPLGSPWDGGNFDAGTKIGQVDEGDRWTLKDGYDLFGWRSFFQEDVYYFGIGGKTWNNFGGPIFDKTTLYGTTDAEKKAMIEKLEDGFYVKTPEGGTEITIPYIYGATGLGDFFGYVYFRDGEDPLTKPHYILINDAQPGSNISIDFKDWGNWTTGDAPKSSWNMMYSTWLANWHEKNYTQYFNGVSVNVLMGGCYDPDSKVIGTNFRMAYFGEDFQEGQQQPANTFPRTATGSYTFPEDLNIVFFISNQDNSYNFNYSLPELNARIGHLYSKGYNLNYNNEGVFTGATPVDLPNSEHSLTAKAGTAPQGAVKAAAWKYGDKTYMGFEDGGNDEDLNDLVFLLNGNEIKRGPLPDPETDPDPNPDDKVIEITETTVTPETTSWIFAAEDLGGVSDFDFNDVVWEVSQTVTTTTVTTKNDKTSEVKSATSVTYGDIKINILAAGGTLPVELLYDGEPLTIDGSKSEIHQMFGQAASDGLYSPVNVGSGITNNAITVKSIKTDGELLTVDEYKDKFKLKVSSLDGRFDFVANKNTATEQKDDNTPRFIIVPGDWRWPKEGHIISGAYTGFADWIENSGNTVWMRKPIEGEVIRR